MQRGIDDLSASDSQPEHRGPYQVSWKYDPPQAQHLAQRFAVSFFQHRQHRLQRVLGKELMLGKHYEDEAEWIAKAHEQFLLVRRTMVHEERPGDEAEANEQSRRDGGNK